MKLNKKKVVIGVCVAGVIGAFAYMKVNGGSKEPVGTPVMTMPVAQKDIEDTVVLKAPLEGTESVDISSSLNYEVLKINVKEGDRVSADQVLAVLDSEKLKEEVKVSRDNLELRKLELNQKVSEANEGYQIAKMKLAEQIDDTQVEYDKAVADYNEAKRQYDNLKILQEQGAESLENLKKQQAVMDDLARGLEKYNVADGKVVPNQSELAELERAQNGLPVVNGKVVADAASKKSIEIAQIELDRKIKDLSDCEIKSTIGGTVTRVYCKVGRFANDSRSTDPKPMFVVENIDHLQMKVNVSEYDIDKIKVGQTVSVTADILGGDSVTGIVSRISPTGEERTSSNGTVERVIPTEIDITGENSKLIAGVTASATIQVAKSENALVVPIEAILQSNEGADQIYRVNAENKVEIIPVETGLENDIEVEVKSDKLQAGDNIIISPDMGMTEGMAVMPGGGMGM